MGSIVSITSGRHRAAVLARRDALVEANLDLVRSIARSVVKMLPPSIDLDDLISAGNLGLLHAATRYRPSLHHDTPFTAYARPVIRGAILDSIKRSEYRNSTCSPLDEAPERSVVVAIDEAIDARRRSNQVRAALGELDARHAAVIEWHYGEELGLADVGERLGVGRSRASQLHMEAVRELRDALN